MTSPEPVPTSAPARAAPRSPGARAAGATKLKAASPRAVWGAMTVVYLVWGSTYLAIAVVVQSLPAQIMMGLRFGCAAAVMAVAIAALRGPSALRVRPRELASAGLVGVLLLGVGLGNVTLAERYVPSGVAALIVAVVPLWAILLRAFTGDRPVPLTWIGVAVGLVGVAVLVRPGGSESVGGSDTSTRTLWSLAIVGGTICWAVGSFLAPRIPTPNNPFVLSTYEMLIGGAFLVLLGLLRGERLDAAAIERSATSGWVAFLYLFLIGSVVAFTAYVWVLDHAPLSLVMTYAYVNPVVAVALGALLLHEPLTPSILVGGAIVVVGVLLVVQAERLRPPAPEDLVPEPDAH